MYSDTLHLNKEYKLVPPDGGWGYAIWIGVVINLIAVLTFSTSVGMIYNDFFAELGMSTACITTLHGINCLSMSIGSFVTSWLIKVMGMRKVAFLGSTLINFGIISTIFVKYLWQFFPCQGLQNAGLGMLFNVSCTAINDYFKQKQLILITVAYTITACTMMVTPLIVQWTLDHYGFHCTLLLMSSMSLQTYISASLIQPVTWHMKKEKISPEKTVFMQINAKEANEPQPLSLQRQDTDIILERRDLTRKYTHENISKRLRLFFINNFDWAFLKQFMKSCECLVPALAIFLDVLFTFLLPQYFYSINKSNEEVAWALSMFGFGDLVTRIILIVASKWLRNVKYNKIYVIGLAVDVIAKFAMVWSANLTAILVLVTIMGGCRCIITVLLTLVISEAVHVDKFSVAIGASNLTYGIVGIVLGPISGTICDVTGDYKIMFYAVVLLMGVANSFWMFEEFFKRKEN